MAKIEVGKSYVVGNILGTGLVPCVCNSTYSPEHPCRVTVLSVGRKYAKAMFSGYTKPTTVPLGSLFAIEEAKVLYRKSLETREDMWKLRGQKGLGIERVNQLVEEL